MVSIMGQSSNMWKMCPLAEPYLRRPLRRLEWRSTTAWLFLCLVIVPSNGGDINSDTQGLLAFKTAVDPNDRLVSWAPNTNPCTWLGVTCSNNRVWYVRLPGLNLAGVIPVGTLGQLDQIRRLSLHSNKLNGSLPSDLSGLRQVQSLYLHSNQLSGPLPYNFSLWPRLVHITFANNQFNGNIPSSLSSLQFVKEITLQNNHLSGSIPDIGTATLTSFDVSNNNLSGPIPTSLQKFPASSFSGNQAVCGPPTGNACGPPPSPPPAVEAPSTPPTPQATTDNKHKKLSTGVIIAIVVGDVALLLLVVSLCLFCYCKRKERRVAKPAKGEPGAGKSEQSKDEFSSLDPGRSKLVFFEGKKYAFDLEDLLRASAEVLGKGSAGTAYKAVLEDGTIVAVKRLKDVHMGKKDFETQIQSIGRMQHRNLVPLRAFYSSKDEKLLVYDYMPAGSLSALLHGTKGGSRTPLDWITRVRVATGAGRGLAYLHSEHNFTHGNIKSSNVLLTRDLEARLSDFGLAQLLGTSLAASRIVGYRAPEVVETRKVTSKADVYSFGVLLLELLTGKAPTQATLNDEGIDLPRWVQSVVREEWTAEVFDLELMRYKNIEEEMVQMLQIAMQCVAPVPDQRPTMEQVVKLLEDVRQFSDSSGNDNGEDTSKSAYDTSGDHDKSKDDVDTPPLAETPSELVSVPVTPSPTFGPGQEK